MVDARRNRTREKRQEDMAKTERREIAQNVTRRKGYNEVGSIQCAGAETKRRQRCGSSGRGIAIGAFPRWGMQRSPETKMKLTIQNSGRVEYEF